MEQYIVFTGNEFGMEIGESEDIIDLSTAQKKFNLYVEEYGTAFLYEIQGNKLILIESNIDA